MLLGPLSTGQPHWKAAWAGSYSATQIRDAVDVSWRLQVHCVWWTLVQSRSPPLWLWLLRRRHPAPPMPVTLCNLHEVPSGGVIVQGLPPPECPPSLAMAAAATERLWLTPTWKTCQWAARAPGSPRPWGGIRAGPGEGGAPSEGLFYRQLSLQGYRPPTKAPLVVSSHWEAWGPHSEENEALFHVPLTPSPTHLPREEPRNEKGRCWPQRPVSQWPSEVERSVSALPLRIPRTRVC